MNYRKRITDEILEKKLKSSGAVLIQGPKWCGKTTSAKEKARSLVNLDDAITKKQNEMLLNVDPEQLLRGETPRLLDEWQLFPSLWDIVRHEVDNRENIPGQFILTGSAVPHDKSEQHHSGAGRFSWVTMRTMSLFESGDSSGSVSLKDLFEGTKKIEGTSSVNLERLAYLCCRGGWPSALDKDEDEALEQAENYYDALVYNDINREGKIRHDSIKIKRFLRSYAKAQGTSTPNTTLAKDISLNEDKIISLKTVAEYLDTLEELFAIEESYGWNPNLRSKSAIRTLPTRYFSDSSIATEALELKPEDLINDLETFDFIFETMAIHDLRVYTEPLKGEVYHYRDSNNLECDAVVHIKGGKYGLCEIKLGGDKLIEEGANSLNKLESIINTEEMGSPSFKMVLVGKGEYAYKRSDEVFVVPITCLRD